MRALAPDPCPTRTLMHFYSNERRFYCGVDLHARTVCLCVIEDQGWVVYATDCTITRQFPSLTAPRSRPMFGYLPKCAPGHPKHQVDRCDGGHRAGEREVADSAWLSDGNDDP